MNMDTPIEELLLAMIAKNQMSSRHDFRCPRMRERFYNDLGLTSLGSFVSLSDERLRTYWCEMGLKAWLCCLKRSLGHIAAGTEPPASESVTTRTMYWNVLDAFGARVVGDEEVAARQALEIDRLNEEIEKLKASHIIDIRRITSDNTFLTARNIFLDDLVDERVVLGDEEVAARHAAAIDKFKDKIEKYKADIVKLTERIARRDEYKEDLLGHIVKLKERIARRDEYEEDLLGQIHGLKEKIAELQAELEAAKKRKREVDLADHSVPELLEELNKRSLEGRTMAILHECRVAGSKFVERVTAAAESKRVLHLSFLCPIMHDVMRDPVVAASGNSYERRAIEQWLQTKDRDPCTNATLVHKELTENITLRKSIEEFYENIL
jgi:hypothetical protein